MEMPVLSFTSSTSLTTSMDPAPVSKKSVSSVMGILRISFQTFFNSSAMPFSSSVSSTFTSSSLAWPYSKALTNLPSMLRFCTFIALPSVPIGNKYLSIYLTDHWKKRKSLANVAIKFFNFKRARFPFRKEQRRPLMGFFQHIFYAFWLHTNYSTENQKAFLVNDAGLCAAFDLNLGAWRNFPMPQFRSEKLGLLAVQDSRGSRDAVQASDEVMNFPGRLAEIDLAQFGLVQHGVVSGTLLRLFDDGSPFLRHEVHGLGHSLDSHGVHEAEGRQYKNFSISF